MFSTALPPSVVGASVAALKMMAEDKNRAKKALFNAKIFTKAMGLPEAKSAIVPLIIGDAEIALAISRKLQNEKFLVSAIRPPTVPEGTARLRFTFSALHSDTQVKNLAKTLRDILA